MNRLLLIWILAVWILVLVKLIGLELKRGPVKQCVSEEVRNGRNR